MFVSLHPEGCLVYLSLSLNSNYLYSLLDLLLLEDSNLYFALEQILLIFLCSLQDMVLFDMLYIILFCVLRYFGSLLYFIYALWNCLTDFPLLPRLPPRPCFKDSWSGIFTKKVSELCDISF